MLANKNTDIKIHLSGNTIVYPVTLDGFTRALNIPFALDGPIYTSMSKALTGMQSCDACFYLILKQIEQDMEEIKDGESMHFPFKVKRPQDLTESLLAIMDAFTSPGFTVAMKSLKNDGSVYPSLNMYRINVLGASMNALLKSSAIKVGGAQGMQTMASIIQSVTSMRGFFSKKGMSLADSRNVFESLMDIAGGLGISRGGALEAINNGFSSMFGRLSGLGDTQDKTGGNSIMGADSALRLETAANTEKNRRGVGISGRTKLSYVHVNDM